jgi:hypothetical protein
MATSAIEIRQDERAHTLSVSRLLVTGAATGAVIFVLCWLGTLIPYSSPTHAYITLFTSAEVSSGRALVEGTFWSLLFAGLAAALFGVIYNRTAAMFRR